MDKNNTSFQNIALIFYKLSLEALFLVVVGALVYMGVEFLLPGLLTRHISFFSVYGVAVISLLSVIVLGTLIPKKTTTQIFRKSDTFLISFLGSLWIASLLEKNVFWVQVLFFFLIFISLFSLIWMLFFQAESHE